MFGVQVINILVNGKATGIHLFILMLIVSCCISCTTKATTTESLEHPYVVPITSDAQVSKSNSLVVKISGELSGPGAVAVHYWSFDGPKNEGDICCRTFTILEVDALGQSTWEVEHTSHGKFSQYRVFPAKSIMNEVEIP